MKKVCYILLVEMMCVSGVMAQEVKTVCETPAPNPFVYQSGKLSIGVISADTLALYDIFKHVEGISARVGGSVTLARYERFGAFVGAASPTSDPSAVALVAGPSFEMDDVARSIISAMLSVLPFKIEATTEKYLNDAIRLKLYGGYDFRHQTTISGAGFGLGF